MMKYTVSLLFKDINYRTVASETRNGIREVAQNE